MQSKQEVRPAATVVLLRDSTGASASGGIEVLLVRRSPNLVFYGGAWVFPGGRIDDADYGMQGPSGRLSPVQAARQAGVRELREEAGLSVDPQGLIHFAQWVTPPGLSRSFDTWYFAAKAPQGEVRVDQQEVDAYRWLSPTAALQARSVGEIELPPPTFVTLSELTRFSRTQEALADLVASGVTPFEPHPCVGGGLRGAGEGTVVHLYPGDVGYAANQPDAPGPHHRLITGPGEWRYCRER